MSARAKRETLMKDIDTGEIIAVCYLTEARAKAIVRAYKLAGIFVEAVA